MLFASFRGLTGPCMLLAALLVTGPSAATAQSFDCRMAATAVEKMICADWELAALDEEMARAFAAARKKPLPDASGGWTRLGDYQFTGAYLTIPAVTGTEFTFELTACSGANQGLIEGCVGMGGMGVTVDGEFAQGDIEPIAFTLADLELLAPGVSEERFAALVVGAYTAFTSSFQLMFDQEDLDGFGAKVVAGHRPAIPLSARS